jgi:N-acetylneuraminate lyase
MLQFPPIPAQKAIMKMLGWDLGPSRLPLQTLDEQQYGQLYSELKAIDFFNRVPSLKTA